MVKLMSRADPSPQRRAEDRQHYKAALDQQLAASSHRRARSALGGSDADLSIVESMARLGRQPAQARPQPQVAAGEEQGPVRRGPKVTGELLAQQRAIAEKRQANETFRRLELQRDKKLVDRLAAFEKSVERRQTLKKQEQKAVLADSLAKQVSARTRTPVGHSSRKGAILN
jgi:hypothetical protein